MMTNLFSLFRYSDGQPSYRALTIGPSGRAKGDQRLVARNDEDALLEARDLVGCYGVEVWDRMRFIAVIEPIRLDAPHLHR